MMAARHRSHHQRRRLAFKAIWNSWQTFYDSTRRPSAMMWPTSRACSRSATTGQLRLRSHSELFGRRPVRRRRPARRRGLVRSQSTERLPLMQRQILQSQQLRRATLRVIRSGSAQLLPSTLWDGTRRLMCLQDLYQSPHGRARPSAKDCGRMSRPWIGWSWTTSPSASPSERSQWSQWLPSRTMKRLQLPAWRRSQSLTRPVTSYPAPSVESPHPQLRRFRHKRQTCSLSWALQPQVP
jgi:hypothetical protein